MTDTRNDRRRLLGALAAGPLLAGPAAAAAQAPVRGATPSPVSVKDFGAAGDGVTDDLPAFQRAIASVTSNTYVLGDGPYVGGPRLSIPPGSYFLSGPLDLKRAVILEGDSTGRGGAQTSVLLFAENSHGIIIERAGTIAGERSESRPTGAADGTIIRNLAIQSRGGSKGHGIWAKARFTAQEVMILAFGDDGYHIHAAAGASGAIAGNANCFQIIGGRVERCKGSGVSISGPDANAGLIQNVDCSHNGGWGFWDNSFLGNTYVACHAAENRQGAYFSGGESARNVYVGCYSESGQPPSNIKSPALVVGGLLASGVEGSGARIEAHRGYLASTNGFYSERAGLTVVVNADPANGDILTAGDAATSLFWRLRKTGADLRFDYGNLDAAIVYSITGPQTKSSFGRREGVPHVFSVQKLGLGNGPDARLFHCGGGAPTSGYYARGERIFYSAPSAGGREGVVCVESGEPGVWKEFGSIER